MAGSRLSHRKKTNNVNRHGIKYRKTSYLQLMEEVNINNRKPTKGGEGSPHSLVASH
ncbi:hypothetical protein [Bacillus sp. AFS031507]|uniref:hypothetical protein n=1 Tax=Bacillus sp. AFS031507 TaxID=2033496 RepID=UPI0015D4AC77|nr:hypothetical protein [Bacillus sp. AFS031507]